MVVDDILTWEEEGDEFLVMGLRLREGIDPRTLHRSPAAQISERQIDELKGYGFVETLPNGNHPRHRQGLAGAGRRGRGSGGLTEPPGSLLAG
jgi:hypothetical protein